MLYNSAWFLGVSEVGRETADGVWGVVFLADYYTDWVLFILFLVEA